MSKIFVTSDTWFNRPNGNMSEYTTNEYNETIISNWNKTVGKKDVVYILGGLGISELYHIIIKLNGEIHILNNYFTQDEKYFISLLKENIKYSADKKLSSKIIFENDQIITLPEQDVILTYFPLQNWYGHDTGTFCLYGLSDKSNLSENSITVKMEKYGYKPICIQDIISNMKKIREKI